MKFIYSCYELRNYLSSIQSSEWQKNATLRELNEAIDLYTKEMNANEEDLSKAKNEMEETRKKLVRNCRITSYSRYMCECDICLWYQKHTRKSSVLADEAKERIQVLQSIVDTLQDVRYDKKCEKFWDLNS